MDTFSSDPALSKLLTDMEKFSEDMKKFNQRLDFYDESLKKFEDLYKMPKEAGDDESCTAEVSEDELHTAVEADDRSKQDVTPDQILGASGEISTTVEELGKPKKKRRGIGKIFDKIRKSAKKIIN